MLQVSLDLHTLLDGENKTKVVTKEVMYSVCIFTMAQITLDDR